MMEFSFRGPPEFWDRIIALAEAARDGGTEWIGNTKANDPAATHDWRITFIGDPVGDGIAMLFIPDEDDRGTGPWEEISERVAAAR